MALGGLTNPLLILIQKFTDAQETSELCSLFSEYTALNDKLNEIITRLIAN